MIPSWGLRWICTTFLRLVLPSLLCLISSRYSNLLQRGTTDECVAEEENQGAQQAPEAQEVAAGAQPVEEAKVDLLSKYAHLLPTRDTDWRQKLAYVAPQPEPQPAEHSTDDVQEVAQPTEPNVPNVKLQSSPLKPLRQHAPVEASSNEVGSNLRSLPLRESLTAGAMQEPATPVVKLVLNEIAVAAPSATATSPERQSKMPAKVAASVVDPVDTKFETQWSQMEKAAETWQGTSAATEGADHPAFRNAKVQLQVLASVSESSLEKSADAAELSAAMMRVKFAAQSLGREMMQLEQAYGACEQDRELLQKEVARQHGTEAKLREEVAALKAQLGQASTH